MTTIYALFGEEYDREGLHTYTDVIELFTDKEVAFRVQWELTSRQSEFERAELPYTVMPWRVK